MIEVTKVIPKEGHVLSLTFSDGTNGDADIYDLFDEPLFANLKDEGYFNQVSIEYGTVCWFNDLDISPEFLYARAHSLPCPQTFEQAQELEMRVSMYKEDG